MKMLTKGVAIASLAALGLGLAACKKDAAEHPADDATEAVEADADATGAPGDATEPAPAASEAAKGGSTHK